MGQRSKKMHLRRARLGRGFLAPRYSSGARRFMLLVGGTYLRLIEGVKSVHMRQAELLLEELEHFYNGKNRLILAFRHVAKEDAAVMMYALGRRQQHLIKKRNKQLPKKQRIIPHAKFLYGRDVLNWAGKAAAWLFPRIGCVPVQNRSTNRDGLDLLRKEMQEGTFPIALAPESQVTYQMYHCSGISTGVSSLASWGKRDDKDVVIVPIAIGYRHSRKPEDFIRSVLEKWQKLTGVELSDRRNTPVLALLNEATEQTLQILETFYQLEPEAGSSLRQRILTVCEQAVSRAEYLAGQPPEGTLLDRQFRIRYRGVEAVHPERVDPKTLPPLGRSLADFHALEAHVYLRNSQIVDVLQYIDPAYIAPPCSAGRACEYALNLLDVINRAQGGTINTRYTPAGKTAVVSVGNALSVDSLDIENLPRRQRLTHLTDEVHKALESTSLELEPQWEKETFRQ